MPTSDTNIEIVTPRENFLNLNLRTVYIIVFFLFIGFLFIEDGADFENYTNYFDLVRTYSFSEVLSDRVEPLFGVLTFFLVKVVTNNFSIYLFLLVLSISIKAYVISSSRQTGAFFVLFVGFYLFRYFPLYELTQIRVSLAIGLVMMAFQLHGTRLKWILFILACLTHYSVLVLLPLLFIVDGAQSCSSTYEMHEIFIWLSLLFSFAMIGFMSHTILQFITPYVSTLQIYDYEGFGDKAVSPFNAAVLLDIIGIITALVLQSYMSASTRFWIYIQVLGVLSFYSLIELPILAFRIKELFCIFWIFYIRDALEYQGAVRWHALLFSFSCIITYFYFYFIGHSAIFTILQQMLI